jgi:hypothetical protein
LWSKLIIHLKNTDMKELTLKELTELCFSLLQDKTQRSKTAQKDFEKGRRKLLTQLKKL